ncbi:carbohydrate ABC transporter permease, partial [Parabacteroides distasonis]
IVFCVVFYPLFFVIIASVSDPNLVNSGKVILLPKGFNLDAYKHILTNQNILTGYLNSIIYTLVWTVLAVCITVPAGYALSRKDLPFRKFWTLFFVFVMYFQGGLVPTYLVVKNLHLMDTMWAVILPTVLS